MNAFEIWTYDAGWGQHPCVIVSHPLRAQRKDVVEILMCESVRARKPASPGDFMLDENDGLDWPTLCRCDLILSVERADLKQQRGAVAHARRPGLIQRMIAAHGWSSL